jgi:hypothetical protein
VGSNDFGWAGARALAGSQLAQDLTRLDLGGNRIRSEGLIALVNSGSLRGLEHLHLGYCEIGTKGIRALAKAEGLGSLNTLDVLGNYDYFGETGARALENAVSIPCDAIMASGVECG